MAFLALLISIPILILIHEAGHFIAAKRAGVKVLEFGFGFPPRLWARKKGETIYSINAIPFGGFVRLHGESAGESIADTDRDLFYRASALKRAGIILAGVFANFLLGWFLIAIVFSIGAPQSVLVRAAVPGSPAAAAGIRAGDAIEEFRDADAFIAAMKASAGNPVTLRIRHRGETQVESIILTPRVNPPAGEGALGAHIEEVGFPRKPIMRATADALVFSLKTIGFIFASLGEVIVGLFRGAPGAGESFVGPVGIFGVASEVARFGGIYLLELIALISLNLAALNILPIPALDGGRLLFIAIEKIKGSPVRAQRESMTHAVGFALLLVLMLVLTVRDVVRLL